LKHVWSRSYETLSPEVRAIWSLPRSPRVADGVRMLMEKMLLRWARWGKQVRDRSRSATLRVLAIAAPSATKAGFSTCARPSDESSQGAVSKLYMTCLRKRKFK
jgi:hypothetical protein